MDTQVEDFLAHYGVAGMRWGKRKSRASTASRIRTNVSTMPKRQVAKRLGGAALVAAGTVAAIAIMSKSGSAPIRVMPRPGIMDLPGFTSAMSQPMSLVTSRVIG